MAVCFSVGSLLWWLLDEPRMENYLFSPWSRSCGPVVTLNILFSHWRQKVCNEEGGHLKGSSSRRPPCTILSSFCSSSSSSFFWHSCQRGRGSQKNGSQNCVGELCLVGKLAVVQHWHKQYPHANLRPVTSPVTLGRAGLFVVISWELEQGYHPQGESHGFDGVNVWLEISDFCLHSATCLTKCYRSHPAAQQHHWVPWGPSSPNRLRYPPLPFSKLKRWLRQ